MKIFYSTIALVTLGVSSAFSQISWSSFGDNYPTTDRAYSDITNFFILEGPGNENPGNYQGLPQTDALRISAERKKYIAQQFTYVLFDQASFCERRQSDGVVLKQLTPLYHSEAVQLMNMNSSLIVLPYFSVTLLHTAHPAYLTARNNENWFVHSTQPPYERLKAAHSSSQDTFYVMDISNANWRNFFASFIRDTVNAYNYRGVFLDNMTYYPYVDVATKAKFPSSLYNNWITHLTTFVNTLMPLVSGKIVICNSIGFNAELFGPNHGLDLMPLVSGGAIMEGFEHTASPDILSATLTIMNYMRDNNKAFLAASHCHPETGSTLLQQFGFSAWTTSPPYPDRSIFYRMQMSFLARYLLVTPLQNNRPFGFSFQPGEWMYSYIPYYKPWEERIGAPLGNYVYNSSQQYYVREFENCIVYVNNNPADGNILTITVPSGYNFYRYYYPNGVGQDVSSTKLSGSTITLNEMEGIVLFKKIDADQKLEGDISIDSIGHWYKSKFVMHAAPAAIPITMNTPEVVKASQKVFSNKKYYKWNNLPDVINHKSFQITSSSQTLLSNFN